MKLLKVLWKKKKSSLDIIKSYVDFRKIRHWSNNLGIPVTCSSLSTKPAVSQLQYGENSNSFAFTSLEQHNDSEFPETLGYTNKSGSLNLTNYSI